MISRRLFMAMTSTAALTARLSWSAQKDIPAMLDHILLGCSDLDRGIEFFERHTGVRAVIGGVHPGRGTRNALLSLGELQYLEIISIDPAQDKVADFSAPLVHKLKSLKTPTLVGWAAHPGNLDEFAKTLKASDIAFDGPRNGSRARPDGKLLKWKTVNLADDHNGVLPFFIEWDSSSVHPSQDAPAGCRLEFFSIADPDPVRMTKTCKLLALSVPIVHGNKSELRARIVGTKGALELVS
jgi:catechol 2,3-dioxygenase-like lactoylglutathione lyase family enzyme